MRAPRRPRRPAQWRARFFWGVQPSAQMQRRTIFEAPHLRKHVAVVGTILVNKSDRGCGGSGHTHGGPLLQKGGETGVYHLFTKSDRKGIRGSALWMSFFRAEPVVCLFPRQPATRPSDYSQVLLCARRVQQHTASPARFFLERRGGISRVDEASKPGRNEGTYVPLCRSLV